jgi:methyl-accepting chemotaxis protein
MAGKRKPDDMEQLRETVSTMRDNIGTMSDDINTIMEQTSHIVKQAQEVSTLVTKSNANMEETKILLQQTLNELVTIKDRLEKLEKAEKESMLTATEKVSI